MEVPVESWAIGPNPNADPAYIIIIVLLPDTVGHAGCLTSALKHKQGDISMLFILRPCLDCCDNLFFFSFFFVISASVAEDLMDFLWTFSAFQINSPDTTIPQLGGQIHHQIFLNSLKLGFSLCALYCLNLLPFPTKYTGIYGI